MEVIYILLTIIYIFSCLFLGFVVLIQKGEGGGLGGAFGGGAVDVAFGAKADMTWKRATGVAAALFMILAIVLGVMQSQLQQQSIAARRVQEQKAEAEKKAAEEEAEGEAPAGEIGDGEAGLETDPNDVGTLEETTPPGAADSGDE